MHDNPLHMRGYQPLVILIHREEIVVIARPWSNSPSAYESSCWRSLPDRLYAAAHAIYGMTIGRMRIQISDIGLNGLFHRNQIGSNPFTAPRQFPPPPSHQTDCCSPAPALTFPAAFRRCHGGNHAIRDNVDALKQRVPWNMASIADHFTL